MTMRAVVRWVCVAVLALGLSAPAAAAPLDRRGDAGTRALWGALTAAEARAELRGAGLRPERSRGLELAESRMAAVLEADELVLSLPHPAGGFERFRLEETPVLAAGLAASHPEITTFAGTGIDDPAATVHADLTPLGFHASVRSPQGMWFVDPTGRRGEGEAYVSYFARDLEPSREALFEPEPIVGEEAEPARESAGPAVSLRVYRLALASDPTYASYHGAANVTAAKATLVSRVSQVYEAESAIRLVLAAGNDVLNLNTAALASEPNGPCGAAPCYTTADISCTSATLNRTRIVIGQLLGASNYDVGHIVLGRNGGGVAGLGVVGLGGKARGCTGLSNPVGDYFAVDYVAHELGHQFGANHTFNGTTSSCAGGNRSQPSSVEPGSGSSIMAYAGICGADNLQPYTDPYWSQLSRAVIQAFVSATRTGIPEVQTVSLTGFDGTDSLKLRFGGSDSVPIVRGTNYSAAGIKAAIEGIAGFSGTVTVAGFAGGTFDDTGFQVTFSGTSDRPQLGVVDAVGATGFVGETDKGGAPTHGGTVEATGNSAPDVSTAAGHTIPVRTPFALTAGGSDPDGDPLTYLWEQTNLGGTTGTALFDNAKANGPLFRIFGRPLQVPPYSPTQYNAPGVNVPTSSPTRVFPDLAQILAGNTNAKTGTCLASNLECFSEFLPTAAYSGPLTFRVTARDGRTGGGGTATADTTLTLATAAGPFLVTSHATAAARPGGEPQTVTWEVAGTAAPPVSAAQVRITLSTDGGLTYPHELAASTANDGSHQVVLLNEDVAAARIRVAALGNVFFAVNDASFPIVQTLPDTTITDGPTGVTNDPSPTFSFTVNRPGATFECRVDGAAFAACASPHTLDPLADGEHTFAVRGVDGADVDPTPATRTFTVDTVPPAAPALSGPSGQTADATPTFTFSGEPGASFACRLDGAAFAPCSSPHTTAKVAAGAHTFEVHAIDVAGNAGDAAGGAFTYVAPPNTRIGKRTLSHARRTATFRFTGSGGIGVRTFQCRLTGLKTTKAQRAWTKCVAPRTYRRLKPGSYTFHVRARDATGRFDPTPAKSTFRLRRA